MPCAVFIPDSSMKSYGERAVRSTRMLAQHPRQVMKAALFKWGWGVSTDRGTIAILLKGKQGNEDQIWEKIVVLCWTG